ncbi:MAG: type IV pilus twitching motility protein PilT [Gemmatimonadales bacterium]
MTATAPAQSPLAPPVATPVLDTFNAVLKKAIEVDASDVHLCAGGPFRMRVRGQIVAVNGAPTLKPADMAAIAKQILVGARKATPDTADAALSELKDVDCSYSLDGGGRFRVNLCSQRGSLAAVLRSIPIHTPTFEQLGLPPVMRDITMEDRGLVLVTGVTGSGKSSTLAAMLGYLNGIKPNKIVTIEDPIEFLHRDQKSIMIQRELGSDTDSFATALRAALRQDPDVIMVGEMRDRETIDIALKAAETGHLVFSTVHTTDAVKTISRLVSVFDADEQRMIRLRLAESLRAVVSQRLLPRKDGKGRVVAVEIMRRTATIEECIADPSRTTEIIDLLAEGKIEYGMQTFDQHIMELYEQDVITLEVAKSAATSPADLVRNLEFR